MTNEEESRDIGRVASELANQMETICKGKPYPAVLAAFAMMLAEQEAGRTHPDIERMLEGFGRWTRKTFEDAMMRRTAFDEAIAEIGGPLQ